ncbi:MAG: hypothetical protein NTU53_20810 [Planctomycetota bacterium]|nr:hypothetical protein [Planctomycetota bacterium]
MTMLQPRLILQLLSLTAALAAAGCQSTRPAASPSSGGRQGAQQPAAIDPCAERLHEICGSLLMHYHLYKRLPQQLSDLSALDAIDKPIPLVCPLSGKPYVYDPKGFDLRGKPGRIIIYDPEPSHSFMRWAINVQETDGPLIADVLDIPEQRFIQRQNAPPAAQQ